MNITLIFLNILSRNLFNQVKMQHPGNIGEPQIGKFIFHLIITNVLDNFHTIHVVKLHCDLFEKLLSLSEVISEENLSSKKFSCCRKIIGCLFLAWTLVCLALIKGVQSYGKTNSHSNNLGTFIDNSY